MRSPIRTLPLVLALFLALPPMATAASAQGAGCAQLRQSVLNNVPSLARSLPYGALDCGAISQIHLLLSLSDDASLEVTQRIQAVFRRQGLGR